MLIILRGGPYDGTIMEWDGRPELIMPERPPLLARWLKPATALEAKWVPFLGTVRYRMPRERYPGAPLQRELVCDLIDVRDRFLARDKAVMVAATIYRHVP